MNVFIRNGRTFLLATIATIAAVCASNVTAHGTSGSGTFIDKRDGKSYKTVKIGGKTWMAQNLNYKTKGSFCYDNKESNCDKYGRIYYDWDDKCPSGWHLPSGDDWAALATAVGGDGTYGTGGAAGKRLKTKNGWFKNGNGTDDYGFSALPGGGGSRGEFSGVGKSTMWWGLDDGDCGVFGRYLLAANDTMGLYSYSCEIEADGNYMRCVQNGSKPDPPIFGTLRDNRDGKAYKTVEIGGKVWMAQNLNYHISSGSWDYDNQSSNGSKYGRLYSWDAAVIACPTGWHLPTRQEWNALVAAVGVSVATNKLKARNGWDTQYYNIGNGTDDYGFSALPGGSRNTDGSFYNVGSYSNWWTATESNIDDMAYYQSLAGGIDGDNGNKGNGFSVRCAYGEATYTLTTNVSASDGGIVSRSPNQTNYTVGTSVTVTAMPSSDYNFIGWTGASTSTSASVTIMMDGNKTLTANFMPHSVSGTFSDNRDNKTYKTVKISGKTWMAENLNYQTPSGSWCYGDSRFNCNKYGRLYDYNTAKTACPTGWHLSTDQEWELLKNAVGSSVTGVVLKARSGWYDNGNGTDVLGFSAMSSGIRGVIEGFDGAGYAGYWWTYTEWDISDNTNAQGMSYDNDNVYVHDFDKSYGFSARCIQGKAISTLTPNEQTVMRQLAQTYAAEKQQAVLEQQVLEQQQQAIEQQQALERQRQTMQIQQTINHYTKQLAVCETTKSDQCAAIMYMLGNTYYQQANVNATQVGGTGRDYSMAIQTYQRLLKEYPASQYLPSAKQILTEMEIASLPPEQQQVARQRQAIDQYKKQLADCEVQKSDRCAVIMYMLGSLYFQQANLNAAMVGGIGCDYSMAIQTYERILKEYPTSKYSQTVKQLLTQIESIQKQR